MINLLSHAGRQLRTTRAWLKNEVSTKTKSKSINVEDIYLGLVYLVKAILGIVTSMGNEWNRCSCDLFFPPGKNADEDLVIGQEGLVPFP